MSHPPHTIPVEATPGSDAWAEDLWRSHGDSVYLLAHALLGDETRAMRAVALGMVDFRRDSALPRGDAGRTLARLVYRRSAELAGEASGAEVPSPVIGHLAHLARLQRASLALCLSGHTYRDAAKVLGVAPRTVAQLLTSGLHELNLPRSVVPV